MPHLRPLMGMSTHIKEVVMWQSFKKAYGEYLELEEKKPILKKMFVMRDMLDSGPVQVKAFLIKTKSYAEPQDMDKARKCSNEIRKRGVPPSQALFHINKILKRRERRELEQKKEIVDESWIEDLISLMEGKKK